MGLRRARLGLLNVQVMKAHRSEHLTSELPSNIAIVCHCRVITAERKDVRPPWI